MRGPPRTPESPQWFLMDNLVCHEKPRYNILLWEDFTMGKLPAACVKDGERNDFRPVVTVF